MQLDRFLKDFGKNLTHIRKNSALRQKEAADKTGISYRYYQNIETGRANITFSTLLKISKYFHVHPCDLLPDIREDKG